MNTGVMLAQMVNWFILAVDVAVALLVGWDTRSKGLSWSQTIMWVAISFCLFPIGVGLYFWLGRPHPRKVKEA